MKYVYGLDLSLNSTGICIFTNDGQFVECMTIDTNDLKEIKLKLKRIGEDFIKIMKVYEPELVVIEQGFTLFNSSTQAIFRVHGIANYIFSQYEQIYLPASSIKKIVGGRGNMTKEEQQILLNEVVKTLQNAFEESERLWKERQVSHAHIIGYLQGVIKGTAITVQIRKETDDLLG